MAGVMAPPLDQSHGLRVMNHREFAIHRQAGKILLVIGQKGLKTLRGNKVGSAMQRIVKCLGNPKEIITPR